MTTPATPLDDPDLRAAFAADAAAQIAFFRASLNDAGGFDPLDHAGAPIPGQPQELHATTRMIHSYALARVWGAADCDALIDAGMGALRHRHRDRDFGGYLWAVTATGIAEPRKLAYGHVFVLLAASSALVAGHDDAARLLADIEHVIERHYWDEARGLLREEFAQDWSAISEYRGMNANMHGAEALMAAYEATGREVFLHRAGRILDFFTARMAPQHGWRIPEHYRADWSIDEGYEGDPMFRPAGTTPGHALEFARLLLQHHELSEGRDPEAPARARRLVQTALGDSWLPEGGLAYTVTPAGAVLRADRYWWPVTEGLGALAALIRHDPQPQDAEWFLHLWAFAQAHFIDHGRGGWYPEIGPDGAPQSRQFTGKPDIYHSLQAMLYPLSPSNAHPFRNLAGAGR